VLLSFVETGLGLSSLLRCLCNRLQTGKKWQQDAYRKDSAEGYPQRESWSYYLLDAGRPATD
jgi:hypothetical protein